MINKDDQYHEAEGELAGHLEDSEVSKLSHFYAAGTYEKRHKLWIGVPATCTAIILTWLLTSPFEDLGVSTGTAAFLKRGLPIIFSLATSILTAVGYFLNYGDLANRHRSAGQKYQEVWRQCKNWKTDFPGCDHAEGACSLARRMRERLNEVNKESPQIPEWAWRSVDHQREKGSDRKS